MYLFYNFIIIAFLLLFLFALDGLIFRKYDEIFDVLIPVARIHSNRVGISTFNGIINCRTTTENRLCNVEFSFRVFFSISNHRMRHGSIIISGYNYVFENVYAAVPRSLLNRCLYYIVTYSQLHRSRGNNNTIIRYLIASHARHVI